MEPVQIWSSTQLIKIFQELGVNDKIGLTGNEGGQCVRAIKNSILSGEIHFSEIIHSKVLQ